MWQHFVTRAYWPLTYLQFSKFLGVAVMSRVAVMSCVAVMSRVAVVSRK